MFWCDKGHSNPDGLAVIGGSSVEPASPDFSPVVNKRLPVMA